MSFGSRFAPGRLLARPGGRPTRARGALAELAAPELGAPSDALTASRAACRTSASSSAAKAWMRAWLGPLQAAGKIDVEEEFKQACFHITVYQNYEPPTAPEPLRDARWCPYP